MELEPEIVTLSMNIILISGDARQLIDEAYDCVDQSEFEKADNKIREARGLLAKAHGLQTDLIQSESDGCLRQHPLILIHAQDSLMTVNSELNQFRRLRKMMGRLDSRLNRLEQCKDGA